MDDLFDMCRFMSMGGEVAVNPQDPNSKKLPLIQVNRWCFKIRPSEKGAIFKHFNIHIKGFRKDRNMKEYYWESSKVLEVRNNRTVLTKNAGYYLYMEMDMNQSRVEGFRNDFSKHFKTGFTPDWKEIFEVYGNYLSHQSSTTIELNKKLKNSFFNRHRPKAMFIRRSVTVSDEKKFCDWIDKNDAWNKKVTHNRKNYWDDLLSAPKHKALDIIAEKFKPINSRWTATDMAKLYTIVTAINPCSNSDWSKVMHLLGQDRPLQEVKDQAKEMIHNFGKKSSPASNIVKRLKKFMPNGQLPKPGTLSRQTLSDELCKILFVYQDELDKPPKPVDYDMDDEFIDDAIANPSLESVPTDESSFGMQMGQIQHSIMGESSCMFGSAENPIDIGDDFDTLPSRSCNFVHGYQTDAFTSRRKQIKQDVQESDDECEILHERQVKREVEIEMIYSLRN